MPKVNKRAEKKEQIKSKSKSKSKVKSQTKTQTKTKKEEEIDYVDHVAENHTLEDEIFNENPKCKYLIGIDETARGNFAGSVIAEAFLQGRNSIYIKGVGDSKKTNRKNITTLSNKLLSLISLMSSSTSCSNDDENSDNDHDNDKDNDNSSLILHAHVPKSAQDIDELNILQATMLAMKEAAEQLINTLKQKLRVDDIERDKIIILVDGPLIPRDSDKRIYDIFLKYETRALVKGDAKAYTIAAASILSKDQQIKEMQNYHELHPKYGFDTNSGYGTAAHFRALWRYGVLPIHRLTFDCRDINGTIGRLKYLQKAFLMDRSIIEIINEYDPSIKNQKKKKNKKMRT